MRIVVAANPNAAFGAHPTAAFDTVAALQSDGHEVELLQRETYAQLEHDVHDAVAAGTDALVIVGGDGMVSLGVNTVAMTAVPLGIVAAGTGNDMARGLGLPFATPKESITALRTLLHEPPQRIDLARATAANGVSRWFGCVLSAGFDALVNERANRMRRPKGASRYIFAMLAELAALRPRHYTIESDGVTRECDAVLVAVGNNTSLGGGMRITPTAKLDDGLVDVLIGHTLGRIGLLKVFPKVFSGSHLSHPAVETFRAKRVTVAAEGVTAYADGERLGPLPVTVEVVAGAVSVFAPPLTP